MDALETANTPELQGSSNHLETSLIDIDGENKPECSILDDNSPLIPEVLQESNSVPPSNDVVHAQISSRQVHRSSVLEMTDEVEREIEQIRAQLRSENVTMEGGDNDNRTANAIVYMIIKDNMPLSTTEKKVFV
nr:unnamed protein product [Callosobruchus analis]